MAGQSSALMCGAANNTDLRLYHGDTITLVYALTSLGIGVAVGIMARLGQMEKLPGAILSACVAGLTAVVITPQHHFLGRTTRACMEMLHCMVPGIPDAGIP